MKTIKFLLFIPVCLMALGIISWTFVHLLNWTIDRTTLWYRNIDMIYFVLIIPFFWGTIWGVFKLAAIGLTALLIPVSPEKKFSLYSIASLSLINCLALLVYFWTRDVDYSWKWIFILLIISVFVVDFSSSIVMVFSKKGSIEISDQ